MSISDLISALALLVAALVAYVQICSSKRAHALQQEFKKLQGQSNDLQKRMIEIEEGRDRNINRAQISASMCAWKPKSLELSISNLSQNSEARNIQVRFDGVAAGPPDSPRQQKILKLLPKKEIRTWYGYPSGEKPSTILVTWEDDSGEAGQYDVELVS